MDSLDRWVKDSFRRFTHAKCCVLRLGLNNPMHDQRLGEERLESFPAEKDLCVLVNNQLHMTYQCAQVSKKAEGILACTRNSVAKGLILSLYSAPQFPCSVLGPSLQDIEMLKNIQRRATELVKGWENKSDEEQLGEMGLISLEKRSLENGPYCSLQLPERKWIFSPR